MSEHTPTPWDADGVYVMYHDAELSITVAGCAISPRMDSSKAKANAAFIVRAVNAHDDLVAALKVAQSHLRTLRGDRRNEPNSDQIDRAVFDAIDAALAKAISP